jgi:hypothetical protein
LEVNLFKIIDKFWRKSNSLELYWKAEKLGGFELRITGDIDDPKTMNLNLLSEWISLAKQIGTVNPILYVTSQTDFKLYQEMILKTNSNVTVGSHGLTHVYYSKIHTIEELDLLLETESKHSNIHRFPYLDYNLLTLYSTSKYFDTDSSIVSSWMYPFKIENRMIEYPITPPTDTSLRNKPVTKIIVRKYLNLIKKASKADRAITLLLHPNIWTVKLLSQLLT